MHNPKLTHWQAIKYLLHYLKQTIHLVFYYKNHHAHSCKHFHMQIGLDTKKTDAQLEVFVFF